METNVANQTADPQPMPDGGGQLPPASSSDVVALSAVNEAAQPQGLDQQSQMQAMNMFWAQQISTINNNNTFKNHNLPLARIKKIMKSDEEVRMISAEAPVIFAKACEMFILELTLRSWMHTEENKRRTLQRNDIATAVSKTGIFDFLIDIVPRDDPQGKRDDLQHRHAMTPQLNDAYAAQYYQQIQHAAQAMNQQGNNELLHNLQRSGVDPMMFYQQTMQAQQQAQAQAQQQQQQQQQQQRPGMAGSSMPMAANYNSVSMPPGISNLQQQQALYAAQQQQMAVQQWQQTQHLQSQHMSTGEEHTQPPQ